ncbi:hypothetical protein EN933_33245 [Mesorhizobium sp. M7A.F.Ca.US.001.01.1.1]|nr:hypothetical protein EN933_33245 [Mesorhizobium sp. M7A.F.Ca.US.001.01.1.1]
MGCATSARSDVFEKGASKSGSLTLNGFFSVPSLMMAMPLARSDGRGHVPPSAHISPTSAGRHARVKVAG